MATVAENRQKWADHAWKGGHEWSPGGTRVGTEMLWWRSLRPRLHALLPTGALLEIAPGFGRWTEYLLRESRELIGVDATERCVEACRERFAGLPAHFSLNDGKTLPMVADSSIDAAFSFDSLVHVEAPEVASYLREVARCLRPGGVGFFHHSNLGAYADRTTGRIPPYVSRTGWRAPSMSARAFREACQQAGLHCLTQEVITWRIRGNRPYRLSGERLPLSDCFSLFVRPLQPSAPAATKVYVNRRFVAEWDQLTLLGDLYCLENGRSHESAPKAAAPTGSGQSDSAVLQAWRHARASLRRRVLTRRDPVARALRAGRCPECGRPLVPEGGGMGCDMCAAMFFDGAFDGAATAGVAPR